MTSRGPLLNNKYGAYYNREVPRENEELTHVGPGTPCGEYFRRFWQPVALSRELKDLPLAIKIMDEELVVFRDLGARLGLLQLHCSHRGTSLEYGIISERGIRCCYHGWLYDVDGTVLETPAEPPDSTYKDRLCHGAYPVHEFEEMIFAYMGPPDKKAALSDLRFLSRSRLSTPSGGEGVHAVQLAADQGKYHGPSPHRVPAHDGERAPGPFFYLCSARDGGVFRDVHWHGLRALQEGGRQYIRAHGKTTSCPVWLRSRLPPRKGIGNMRPARL